MQLKKERFEASEAIGRGSEPMRLERQVVSAATFGCWLLSRREGSGGPCYGLCRREGRHSLGGYGRTLWNGLAAGDVVGANLVEPTAIVLVGIDIELDGHILTILDIELLDAVFAKETEDTLAGILTGNLDDILLRHPGVTRTVRHSAVCW